jgi:DNA-binding beta-propeller fold protein YncE
MYVVSGWALNLVNGDTGVSSTVATLANSGLNAFYGLAVSKSGDVYVSSYFGGSVKLIPAGTSSVTTFVGSLGRPFGVATDIEDNVYVADEWATYIRKYNSAGSLVAQLGSGLTSPRAVAVDSTSGDVYVGESGGSSVIVIRNSTGAMETLGSGLSGIEDLAIAPNGDVYITASFLIKIIPSNNGPIRTFSQSTSFISFSGIALGNNSDVYASISDNLNDNVFKYLPGNGTSSRSYMVSDYPNDFELFNCR